MCRIARTGRLMRNVMLTLLLKRQKELCQKGLEAFAKLIDALEHNASGAGVTTAVHGLEPILNEFAALDEDITEFLKRSKVDNIYSAIQAQPISDDRDVAMRLFAETNDLQNELKERSTTASNLLKRSKLFIDFHMNVLSHVRAETTYGPPGKGENVSQGRKMFEAHA